MGQVVVGVQKPTLDDVFVNHGLVLDLMVGRRVGRAAQEEDEAVREVAEQTFAAVRFADGSSSGEISRRAARTEIQNFTF